MRRQLPFAALFLALFALLHFAYMAARDTWLERLVVDKLTVIPAAAIIDLLTPELSVRPVGPRIQAPRGSLSILGGCEGTESMFLLMAAFLAFPMPLRRGLSGIALGILLIYALNQARIVILFYAFRSDHHLFNFLHGTVLPLAIIVAACLFFLCWAGTDPDSSRGPTAAG